VVFAVFLCLSVRLSVYPSVRPSVTPPALYRNYWTTEAGIWHEGFLPPIPHYVIRQFGYLQKWGTCLWNFVSNCGLRKFRHAKSIALSAKLVAVVDGRVCRQHRYDNRRLVAVYYKSVNCNANSITLLCCGFVVKLVSIQLTRFWLRERVARSVCCRTASCWKTVYRASFDRAVCAMARCLSGCLLQAGIVFKIRRF